MIRPGSLIIGSLFFITITLVMLGVMMVLSASQFIFTLNPDRNVYEFMGKQLMWLSLGLAAMAFFAFTDYNVWERWARWILLLNIVLLAMVIFTPFGTEIRGSRRWLNVGFNLGQPSEFTKLAIIIYLSALWAERNELLGRFWRGVFFPMCLVGLSLLLILKQPDHGTVVFIGMLALTLWFAAGGRMAHMAPVFVLFTVAVVAALVKYPHLYERITAFMNPEQYRFTTYQDRKSVV